LVRNVKPKIEFGTPDLTWSEYGFLEAPIILDGRELPVKMILKHGDYVTVTSHRYRLFPNEEALRVAEAVAKNLNLEPLQLLDGSHVVDDKWKRHIFYALPRQVSLGGDTMRFGVAIHNSVDKSTGFGAGVFSFRFLCENMVWAGFRQMPTRRFEEGVSYFYRKHTQGFEFLSHQLESILTKVLEQVYTMRANYENMIQKKLNRELILKLQNSRLPDKLLPDYVVEPKTMEPNITQWECYNDITEAIWHNPETSFTTKTWQYNWLHNIMPVLAPVVA